MDEDGQVFEWERPGFLRGVIGPSVALVVWFGVFGGAYVFGVAVAIYLLATDSVAFGVLSLVAASGWLAAFVAATRAFVPGEIGAIRSWFDPSIWS